MLPKVTGEMRLWADPELRFLPNSGKAVATIPLVASDQRKKDDGTWEDTETLFVRGTVWEKMAENAVESLKKGDLVLVTGRIYVREYEAQDGSKQRSVEMKVETIAPSLRFRSTPHSDAPEARAASASPSAPPAQASAPASAQAPAQTSDPWGAPPF